MCLVKKRLRKKLRKGEFAEYGFEFVLHWDPEVTNWEKVVDAVIAWAEARNLGWGGGGDNFHQHGFMQDGYHARKTVTNADRDAFFDFVLLLEGVTKFELGPLVDAWYPPDDDFGLPDRGCCLPGPKNATTTNPGSRSGDS